MLTCLLGMADAVLLRRSVMDSVPTLGLDPYLLLRGALSSDADETAQLCLL